MLQEYLLPLLPVVLYYNQQYLQQWPVEYW